MKVVTKKKLRAMETPQMNDQFRFFTTYMQWSEFSSITKCYVTDICVPSYEINSTPLTILHVQYKLRVWIILACPNETVVRYLLKSFPFLFGFVFRGDAISNPAELFDLCNTSKMIRSILPNAIKIGWCVQWHRHPFSPKLHGWRKNNELSKPHLPPIEEIVDVCIMNWQVFLSAQQFNIYFKRLLQLGIPSTRIIVPYVPENPISLYERNVMGITTHHLSCDRISYFFPLEKPIWLEPPKKKEKNYK